MSNNVLELFNFSADEVKYNCRIKSKKLPDGSLIPYDCLISDRFIFNPDGVVKSDYSKHCDYVDEYRAAHEEIYLGITRESCNYVPDKHPDDNIKRSKRRAKNAIFDLILCNDFDCFVTLTLDKNKIDRKDYNVIIKKLNTYLDNRVRRNGLLYVGVPELHKDGSFHFHFLCNASALKLVDSDTVIVKGHKKPIKNKTADRYGVPLDERRTVYNISDWSLGFTTAVKTYGSIEAVAHYIGKYITKSEGGKVGGRWYYSGGKLQRPVLTYQRVSFNAFDDYTYSFDCSGGRFKVVKYNGNKN